MGGGQMQSVLYTGFWSPQLLHKAYGYIKENDQITYGSYYKWKTESVSIHLF